MWFYLALTLFKLMLFKIKEFSRPTFSTTNFFSCPEFLKTLSPSGFSISIFDIQCHDSLLLAKYDVALMALKRLKIPWLVICGIKILMVLGGFKPILSLLLRPDPTLCISVQLFRLKREIFQSLYPHLPMEVIACLEWMSISSKCGLPIASSLGPTVITYNKACTIPSWSVFVDWSVINFWAVYSPNGVDSRGIGGILLR